MQILSSQSMHVGAAREAQRDHIHLTCVAKALLNTCKSIAPCNKRLKGSDRVSWRLCANGYLSCNCACMHNDLHTFAYVCARVGTCTIENVSMAHTLILKRTKCSVPSIFAACDVYHGQNCGGCLWTTQDRMQQRRKYTDGLHRAMPEKEMFPRHEGFTSEDCLSQGSRLRSSLQQSPRPQSQRSFACMCSGGVRNRSYSK